MPRTKNPNSKGRQTVLRAFREAPNASLQELVRATGYSQTTVYYHLENLRDEGVITRENKPRGARAGVRCQRMSSSSRKFEVLNALDTFIRARRYSPTVEELTYIVSIKSQAAVYVVLSELESEGYISRKKGSPRGLKIEKLATKEELASEKELASQSAREKREALRMRRMRAEKRSKKDGAEDRMKEAVALGRKNDARARGESLLDDQRSLFCGGRVRGAKIG